MNIKSIIAPLVHQLGYRSGFSTRRARSLPVGRILMFHGTGDESYPADLFEAHLRYLQRHFEIVKLETLLQRFAAPDGDLTDAVALTFDDGLRNNYTVAYPILQRLNLPATFFVCPGLITNQRWLWNQEARARLNRLDAPRRTALAARWSVPADVERIVGWMKMLPLKERLAREQELRDQTPTFQPSAKERQQCDLMNWDELRSLDSALIAIGSHSVSHPILSTLRPGELTWEIQESRRLLENKLARRIEYFCYPNGAFNPTIVEETRKHYAAAVATGPGFLVATNDRHTLPRIGIADNLPLLAWRMHRPTA